MPADDGLEPLPASLARTWGNTQTIGPRMKRRPGPYKAKAVKALRVVGDLLDAAPDRDTPLLATGAAVTYALLEVAHQVGRVADNVPMWGPEEER